jgi:hypothetical protein
MNPESRAAEVARELVRRRADLVDHARGSLEQHLLGVHAVLVSWGQPERVRLAGLLHSAYSTEAFGHRLFGRADRPRVRELVGADAERLVFAFCACRRDALLSAAATPTAMAESGAPVKLATRWRGVTAQLARRDLAELMVIHAANLVEQACLPRGGPAPCLAAASQLLAAARSGAETTPPAFDGGAVVMTAAEEASLLQAYRALLPKNARRQRGSATAARGAVRAGVLSSSPVGEPLVLSGVLALADRRGEEAAALGERALAAFGTWGVAWDKRLRLERWRQLARLLVRDGRSRDRELDAASRRARAVVENAGGSPARLWAQLDALHAMPEGPLAASVAPTPAPAPSPPAAAEDALPPRFARYIAGLRTNGERPMLQFYPGLRVAPWHDAREFPIVADLERLAPEIAAEARGFDARRFQDEAEEIGRQGRWGVLFLLEMGRRNEPNLARCPALRWIIEHHRTLTTQAGLMYFSCLDPGTRVLPHWGPTNVRLRCHLGLEVPDGCGMRVGGVAGAWREGRCLVFDDSFSHEVWNDGDRRRVVLVLDLWHPDLRHDEVELLAGLHRYGAANGAEARKYWARNDAALRRAQAPARIERAAARDGDGESDSDTARTLDALITKAMNAGDLELASKRAARYAQLCRATRWYPAARDDDPPLPASVRWAPVLTPSKLLHDIEQLEYLQERGVLGEEFTAIVEKYDAMLDTLRPLGDDARVPLIGAARAEIGHVYNRLVHVRLTPRVGRALSREWDPASVQDEYLEARPNAVVVDRFLSDDALRSLRRFCLESTVWSTNRYDHGRLGSFFRDGFNCPLLVQIAEELRATLPRVIGPRKVTQVWGYKYATTQPTLPAHADFAAVNVNFWITPDDANLEPGAGGLVLYDVEAPKEWEFSDYNRNANKIRALLASRNAHPTHIPYRCNRAVIFDSDLFHTTPALTFRGGYENRRINVTVLFGDRHDR